MPFPYCLPTIDKCTPMHHASLSTLIALIMRVYVEEPSFGNTVCYNNNYIND